MGTVLNFLLMSIRTVFKYLVAEGGIKRVFEDFYRLFIDPEVLSLFFFLCISVLHLDLV